jgi:hypothetical protein
MPLSEQFEQLDENYEIENLSESQFLNNLAGIACQHPESFAESLYLCICLFAFAPLTCTLVDLLWEGRTCA